MTAATTRQFIFGKGLGQASSRFAREYRLAALHDPNERDEIDRVANDLISPIVRNVLPHLSRDSRMLIPERSHGDAGWWYLRFFGVRPDRHGRIGYAYHAVHLDPASLARLDFAPWDHESGFVEDVLDAQADFGEYAIDLAPCGDDRPFTAQLGRWDNYSSERFDRLSPLQETGLSGTVALL